MKKFVRKGNISGAVNIDRGLDLKVNMDSSEVIWYPGLNGAGIFFRNKNAQD